MKTGSTEKPFGLYVHWPFCKAKCPYCDFNSHVRHSGVDHQAFTSGLIQELKYFAKLLPGRQLQTIFFGGGTPSLMPPKSVAEVIDCASSLWPVADDLEITLEANPTSVEAARFQGYKLAGVNRVSVGVQALNDSDLKFLGRQHSVDEALSAFRLAAKTFDRTSFDLIYARPNQTLSDWREELKRALDEQQGHMSLYQLTIEPGTAFSKLYDMGAIKVPEDGLAAELYDATQELTESAGLPAYEISNHAVSGHECRHNLIYWNYLEYAGIGPGAHSRLLDSDGQLQSVVAESNPESWLQSVLETQNGIVDRNSISNPESATELLLMGLRLRNGFDLQRYEKLNGDSINEKNLGFLIEGGFLQKSNNGKIFAKPKGRRVLNSVISELLRDS